MADHYLRAVAERGSQLCGGLTCSEYEKPQAAQWHLLPARSTYGRQGTVAASCPCRVRPDFSRPGTRLTQSHSAVPLDSARADRIEPVKRDDVVRDSHLRFLHANG